jgi:septal ring-binding cell division protein DamX
MRRVSLLAPSQAITQSASMRNTPSGVSTVSSAWSASCCSAQQPVLPAQVDTLRARAGDQRLFQVVLLQVDHRRHLVAGLGQQVELVDQLVAEEHLADLPAHARRSPRHAQAVPHLQRPLGVADGARADADGVVVVEHTTGRPRAAQSSAAVRPIGPAPTTTTGWRSAAFALRRRSAVGERG